MCFMFGNFLQFLL